VLTGQGRSFSAGVDTKWAARASEAERNAGVLAINRMVHAMYSCAIPTVAAVNGHAHGGGLILAPACDLRIATDANASLALDEAAAGIPFPAGPINVVVAELDPSVARQLCLTSKSITTGEALALRVVDEVVPAADLLERAQSVAAELAAQRGFAAVKAQLRQRVAEQLAAIVDSEQDPMLEGWLAP